MWNRNDKPPRFFVEDADHLTDAPPDPIDTAELRAAWLRAGTPLRFMGWTFAKAMSVPTVAWALQKSALAARQRHHLPAQPRLI